MDRLLLEDRLEYCLNKRGFFEDSEDWVCLEGKPCKSFLHLEDIKKSQTIDMLYNSTGQVVSDTESILQVLKDFYTDLYSAEVLSPTKPEIQSFLDNIPSIPKIIGTINITEKITAEEVELVTRRLHTGKAPSYDGLTADFYIHFAEDIYDCLALVFNQILQDGSLTESQKLAIIVLLFKKGDPLLVTNCRPISLTNCDYKLLAYILVGRIEEHLPMIIHPSHTAYMKGCFIGTNIKFVQDAIRDTVKNNNETIVLFLDFKKAFDSVNHLFMLMLLHHMGFPLLFVAWIMTLYK